MKPAGDVILKDEWSVESIRPNGSRECRVCHANTERDRRASTSR